MPAASTTGSISTRAAPEQMASGTRSAAKRTASRTCSWIVDPSAAAARYRVSRSAITARTSG